MNIILLSGGSGAAASAIAGNVSRRQDSTQKDAFSPSWFLLALA